MADKDDKDSKASGPGDPEWDANDAVLRGEVDPESGDRLAEARGDNAPAKERAK